MANDLVLDRGGGEGRVLITEDTDFVELVYAHLHGSGGATLLRFPARVRSRVPAELPHLIKEQEDRLIGPSSYSNQVGRGSAVAHSHRASCAVGGGLSMEFRLQHWPMVGSSIDATRLF